MDLSVLEIPAMVLLSLCAVFLLLSQNWRWSVFSLALLYVGVFILISSAWPLLMSLTKLIAGWIAGVVLSAAMHDAPSEHGSSQLSDQSMGQKGVRSMVSQLSANLFGLLAAGMVALVALSVTPVASTWVPGITTHMAAAGVLLIGLGALHLGMTSQTFRVVLGLLTVLAGFEIIYAAVESSLLVAGLLSGVTLGLALVGSYLIMAPQLPS